MMYAPDIIRVLASYHNIGRPYKDPYLEAERVKAIIWLRTQSKRGWVWDTAKIAPRPVLSSRSPDQT